MHSSIVRAPFALVLAATLAASYVGSAAPARAQDDSQIPPPQQQQQMDAPSVARLSDVEGSVALKHGDAGDQAAAVANAPIVAGDYLTTGADGRAEVQLDANTLVRAGANAQVRFTQLDGANDVAQVAEGSVELRVFATGQDNVQVQTPSVDVEPQEAGEYLIAVTSDGNTEITSRTGSVAVVTPQGSQQVTPGRTMVVTGQASSPQYQYIDEVAQTDVEAWGDQRDQMMIAANSAQSQYLPSDMTGTADLNQYGNWVDIPGYGQAWVPSDVAQGWTPYSNGTWVSLNYYGPTWVAAEPWGWAPYHYGRWFFAPTVGWAWTPGPRYAHPMWSPALVAFFGYGGGVGVGVGFGNVGWVPLAPGEFYRPWWGVGASLSFNLSYSSFRNYAHGFVGVPWNTWQHGFINRAQPMSVAQLQGTHFYSGRVPLQRFAGNTQYTNRGLASNFPNPNYQRFNAIHPIGGSVNRPATYRTVSASAWQHFDARPEQGYNDRPSYARSAQSGYARPQGANGSPGWQRFNGGAQQYQSRQYAQPQRQYQSYPGQRQYQSYPTQRQYSSYPSQRQYQSYPTQRQYSSYPSQRQYQSYPAARQYYPQQRQYQRSQPAPRSAPSHTSSGGGSRPHGPGRP
jgi:FecR protein